MQSSRVKLESENYFFFLNRLVLREELRSTEGTAGTIRALRDLLGFQVTEMVACDDSGAPLMRYRYDYSEPLPPDKDRMALIKAVLLSLTLLMKVESFTSMTPSRTYGKQAARGSRAADLLAEREGFEPPETFQPLPISRSASIALCGAGWTHLVMPGMGSSRSPVRCGPVQSGQFPSVWATVGRQFCDGPCMGFVEQNCKGEA